MQSTHSAPHRASFLPWFLLFLVLGGGGYLFREELLNLAMPKLPTRSAQTAGTALDGQGMLKRIQELNTLEAAAYHLEVVVPQEKAGTWWKLWQDQQKALFIADGTVTAGVDLGQLTAADVKVSAEGTLVRITLPSVKVLDTDVDALKAYDYETGLLGLIHLDESLRQQAMQSARTRLQEIACESNILQTATENSKRDVERLFSLIDGVEVVVDTRPAASCMN